MKKNSAKIACNEKKHIVKNTDLPLSCPRDEQILWNAHPKVYLPIEKSGQEICPYCGIKYILKDFTAHDN